MKRRDFLRAAGGSAAAATAATAAQPATAAEGDGGGGGGKRPDWGGWLDGIDGGFKDARGQKEVTVKVGAQGNGGAFAFEPAGLWVDTGTTVKWEWTGQGGGHNVVAESGPASLDSGSAVSSSGVHYEHTFEKGGITTYYCDPHRSLDMKGAVAVGDEVSTAAAGGGQQPVHELGVPIQAHWVGIGAILGIVGVINYTFYVLKYGESPNTGNTGGGEG
jgi:halocyanin-like protein